MLCSRRNEQGESLLLCPCGDAFSLQRGAVEHHYDKKHAVDEGCPWRSRGCTNYAQVSVRSSYAQIQIDSDRYQDVKGHIRDKHCRTYFTCPICLRSDFSCERSMKNHSKACKKREAGFVFCGKCKSAWSNRAALVIHAAFCVAE
jgi:hypothetical protein